MVSSLMNQNSQIQAEIQKLNTKLNCLVSNPTSLMGSARFSPSMDSQELRQNFKTFIWELKQTQKGDLINTKFFPIKTLEEQFE